MSKGGVTYSESDQMTPYERQIAIDTLKEIFEEQTKSQQQAMEAARMAKQNDVPKSGLHQRR